MAFVCWLMIDPSVINKYVISGAQSKKYTPTYESCTTVPGTTMWQCNSYSTISSAASRKIHITTAAWYDDGWHLILINNLSNFTWKRYATWKCTIWKPDLSIQIYVFHIFYYVLECQVRTSNRKVGSTIPVLMIVKTLTLKLQYYHWLLRSHEVKDLESVYLHSSLVLGVLFMYG